MVDEIVKNGGDIIFGHFPGKFSDVSKAVKVSRSTVEKIFQQMRTDHSIEPCKHGGNPTNLTPGDLLLVETFKNERPTTSLRIAIRVR